ncbi:ParB N-terminal domain-containing protein (plasmid) [Phormidium sp. CLA17]|uniref:ParB/RepB/Spo0J family partition protein n=1 Tax=Leptolyngbya sp. Cla-17 TaxID=2803751 RepID=UPI001491F236|nr:ParB/RepB/Spo0J family partition protein [Leptolyngbya sp. Cla-17]MBM0745309.1 ParB N-terminal domain-containing protein [Leptolyngbya sp. Cla-17]
MAQRPSVREFLSSSQKLNNQTQELKDQVVALESERTQLLQQLEKAVGSQVVAEGIEVPIVQIQRRPYKSRREKDPIAHAELVDSIRTYGFRGAIWVQKLPDGSLRLIAGESRLDAAIDAGLEIVKVDVIDTDDVTAVKLSRIENVRRRNLNELDDTKELLYLLTLMLQMQEEEVIKLLRQMKNATEGNAALIDPQQEQIIHQAFAEVAPDISWQSFVSVRLRLLNLPEDVMVVYNSGKLSYTKALAIAQVEKEDFREQLLEASVSNGWTIDTLTTQIKALKSGSTPPKPANHPVIARLEKMEEQIQGISSKKVVKMSAYQKRELLTAIERMEKALQGKKAELQQFRNEE